MKLQSLTLSLIFVISSFSYVEAFDYQNQNWNREHAKDTTNKSELINLAKEKGTIRVIVFYDIPYDRKKIKNNVEREAQKEQMEVLHKRFLRGLNGLKTGGVKKSKYGNWITLSVDEKGVNKLYSFPFVKSITKEMAFTSNSDVSTTIVKANDVWNGLDIRGAGSSVVILDSGVDSDHEALAGRVIDGACFSTNDSNIQYSSVCDFGNEEAYGIDAGKECGVTGCDHGTNVAGIAAGGAVNNLSGIANESNIISIQVFSQVDDENICSANGESTPCIRFREGDLLEALDHVYYLSSATNYNIAAVNMSLGGGEYDEVCDEQTPLLEALKESFDDLSSNGILPIAASGNDGFDDALGFPACISSSFSVGATNDQDVHWSESNAASFLDITAPGVNINAATPNNNYASFTGTSQAAPHVSGTAALMKSANYFITPAEISQILKTTANEVSGMNGFSFTSKYGHGRLNSFKAVVEALKLSPDAEVFDYDHTYAAGQFPDFQNKRVYVLEGNTLTVNGDLSLINTKLYILGTLAGNGTISLSGGGEIVERLNGQNNFQGTLVDNTSTYEITVRNDFNGQDGGLVGVGLNESAISKNSPHVVEVKLEDQLNLRAYDSQSLNGYTWVFNNYEGSVNKSKWERRKNGVSFEINNSQIFSRTVEQGDIESEFINIQKKNLD